MEWRIAAVQPEYPENADPSSARRCLDWALDQVGGLRPGQADLVVLPEYLNVAGLERGAEGGSSHGQMHQRISAAAESQARRLGCLIVYNCLVSGSAGLTNTSYLVGPEGVLAQYDKIHLTDVESREWGVRAGAATTVCEYRGIRIGFATCFDVYFPEHFEALAAQRLHIIVHPSYQRSETGDRIRLLSSARAFDAGAWLVRASYARPGGDVGGHTLIAGPDGSVTADLGQEVGVLEAGIDPEWKLVKPASYGREPMDHRSLMDDHRRPRGLHRREHVCAHRGASGVCPENTLPAFGAALGLGVGEMELDLWLSVDGVPVVCHDPSLLRTAGVDSRITDTAWKDIRSLDASAGMEDWTGVRMPRFEEVLDLVGGRILLNIHIKDPGPDGALVALVAHELRVRGLGRWAYIAGDRDVLTSAVRLCPEIPRACLAAQNRPLEQVEAALETGCERVQFGRNVDDEIIGRARNEGLRCNLFYSDDPEEAHTYLTRGIDVILTNYPHRMLHLEAVSQYTPRTVGVRHQ